MRFIKIDSSNIKNIFYDVDKKELLVFFHSGSMYKYFNVEENDIEKFNKEKEKGKYFINVFSKKYEYKKIY